MFEVPTAQGLMVCELVITDAATRNLTLVNRFNRLAVGGFPSAPRRFTVVAVLVNGFGDLGITLEVTNLATDEVVFDGARVMRFPDRLAEVSFVYTVDDLVFEEAAEYEVALYAEGEPLGRNRLTITA